MGDSSLTISARPDGVWAGWQLWIARDERSGFADAHRDDGKRFVVRAEEKLTAFSELEWADLCFAGSPKMKHAGLELKPEA